MSNMVNESTSKIAARWWCDRIDGTVMQDIFTNDLDEHVANVREENPILADIMDAIVCFTKENIEEVSVFSVTNDTLIAWYAFFYLKNSETVCYEGIYVSIDGWFCIVEASDSNLYFRDAHENYKLIPQDIAERIRQAYNR